MQTLNLWRRFLQAASGQLSKAQLSKEEDRLNRMQKRLGGLQEDYEKTATSAGGLLSFLGLGGGGGSAATAAGGTGDAKKAAATAGKGQPPGACRAAAVGCGAQGGRQLPQLLAQTTSA